MRLRVPTICLLFGVASALLAASVGESLEGSYVLGPDELVSTGVDRPVVEPYLTVPPATPPIC